jgi:hypothetical protein
MATPSLTPLLRKGDEGDPHLQDAAGSVHCQRLDVDQVICSGIRKHLR